MDVLQGKHKGRLAARFIKAAAVGALQKENPIDFAKRMRWTHAEIIEAAFTESWRPATEKTAVGGNTSATMSPALRTVGQDLAAVVRPLTVIGRLEGFRRVPVLTQCITATAGAVGYWGAEGAAISVSAGAFEREQLQYQLVGSIGVITEELATTADPDAESAILRDNVAACVEKMDTAFLDPDNAGSPEILPASVTRYCRQFYSTGMEQVDIDGDLKLMLLELSNGGSDLSNAAWIMNPRSAVHLAALRAGSGAPCFPGMGARGGQLLGLPALTSKACTRAGSPEETFIALVDPSRIWLTEADAFELSASRQTDIQMDNASTGSASTGTGTQLVSMFQTHSAAIKAVGRINWKPVDYDSAAVVLRGVNF